MREILSDLVAEQQSLDQSLQRIPIRDWQKQTRAGVSVRDIVSHLAADEELAHDALDGSGSLLAAVIDQGDGQSLHAAGVERGRQMRPQDVIEWWRGARAKVVESLSRRKAEDPVPWVWGQATAKQFAALRMLETWRHGLDIYGALRMEVEDTARLRHIAWIGWEMLPHRFAAAGEDFPHPPRLEVMGPAYAKWVFGPEGGTDLIKGGAGDWCRLVTGRISAEDATSLKAEGAVAEAAVRIVGHRS